MGPSDLNGIWASPDGSTVYIDGPMRSQPNACCELYAIDLATHRARSTGDLSGIRPRSAASPSGSIYPFSALSPRRAIQWETSSRPLLSGDYHWLLDVA
jgi:hypothetical protein